MRIPILLSQDFDLGPFSHELSLLQSELPGFGLLKLLSDLPNKDHPHLFLELVQKYTMKD